MEKSLILLKPDSIQRSLVGPIISKIEQKGIKIVGIRMLQVDENLAKQHYHIHEGKPFFTNLIEFITSAPIIAIVFEAPNCVSQIRSIVGATDPSEANPGTIRGDLASTIDANLIHASDSIESAEYESELFFPNNEIFDYQKDIEKWL
tara:strand:- start:2783 stop:3226 length:444 start_codon:yes stop_codon:yes gene_type:complete